MHIRCEHGIYPHCARCDAQTATDAQDMELVQRHSVTLADLYRRGRAAGLLRGVSGY